MPDTEQEYAHLNVEDLQARLADRERLVEELTSRLEQAAEQLDRLKRTGADRGGRAPAGPLPPELIEQQQSLTEELQAAVQSWEDMQPAALLSRIEEQLADLHTAIMDRSADMPAAVSDPGDRPESSPAAETPPSEKPPSGLSTYEAFKAGLISSADLGDVTSSAESRKSVPATDETSSEEDSAAESADDRHAADADTATWKPAEDIPPVKPPEDIDRDDADRNELLRALDQRDAYITYLIRRLRAAEAAPRLADHLSDAEHVPQELVESLKSYEHQLEETLRMAEVETSLERARLGREAAQLELQKQQLEREMKRLGMSSAGAQFSEDAEATGEAATPARKWWQIFGGHDSTHADESE